MDPNTHNYGSKPQESTTSDEIEMTAEMKTHGVVAANATMTESNLERTHLKEGTEENHHKMDKMEPEWNQSKWKEIVKAMGIISF